MKQAVIIGTLFIFMADAAVAGWPTIGRRSVRSAKANAKEEVLAAGFEVSAGPDGSVRAAVDLMGMIDKNTKFFGSDFAPFAWDLVEYGAVAGVAKVGYDTYTHYKEKDERHDREKAAAKEPGAVNIGRNVTVNGSVDTLGNTVNVGDGSTINGSINTGPAQEKE